MTQQAPTILWLRRDLRLSDHAALVAAISAGGPVIPVFIRDDLVDGLGAAPKWRLGLGLEHFAQTLAAYGSRLILRSGPADAVLDALIAETGAGRVYWHRTYDPQSNARDAAIKATLKARGIEAKSFGGHTLFEPTAIETKTGGFYRVYSPYWRAVKDIDVPAPLPAPHKIPAPERWPETEALEGWQMGFDMRRGAAIVAPHLTLGEKAAQDRLAEFIDTQVAGYKANRDFPWKPATSNLSENLAVGEISPHQCWHAGMRARHEGKPGAEHFLKEVVWREFAYHLMVHSPQITHANWKPAWDAFPWQEEETPEVTAWKQGRTGIRFVDAGMREMYVTGRMHNRARMIVASYLTKHLMTHWRVGQKWFEACLVDWDPASNAIGWQWASGSGPDAAPYFRVFNPVTQLDKFDADRNYAQRWIAEGQAAPCAEALSYYDAIPKRWGLAPSDRYPAPMVTAEEGRKRALAAYDARDF